MKRTISIEEAQRMVSEGEALSSEERLKLQQKRLKELVTYVREHSPYFKDLYKDLKEEIHGQLIAQRLMKNSNPCLNDFTKYRRASIVHTSPGASSYSSWLRMRAAHADYLIQQGCKDFSIIPSDKPLIPSERGGKAPLYCRL